MTALALASLNGRADVCGFFVECHSLFLPDYSLFLFSRNALSAKTRERGASCLTSKSLHSQQRWTPKSWRRSSSAREKPHAQPGPRLRVDHHANYPPRCW